MKNFEVKGKVWRYQGEGETGAGPRRKAGARRREAGARDSLPSEYTSPWHFVYVPLALSRRIKDAAKNKKKVGFHFVRIKATVGKTSWNTTLFPTKDGPYLIAIKADVRQKEKIAEGDVIKINCALI